MKFLAHLQSMAEGEIKAMIPPYYLEDIKRKDPKPLFKAFVVGQEGEAESKWVGVGKVVKTWFADAIGKLVRKIYAGMSLFHGHAETNAHEGRTQIGEVAGARAKTIDGKFSALIAAYIYPEYKDLPLDIASIEADIKVDNDMSGDIHAVDIDNITGIALGNSAVQKPGFPGATLLGTLQAFVNGQSQFTKGGGKMPTLDEIKKFVSEEGLSPSEVFGRDQLVDDPVVKGYVDEEKKIATSGEFAHRKRTDDKFDEEKKKWEDEKKKLDDELKGLKTESAKTKAAKLFADKAKERNLDKKQISYIEKKLKSFEPEDPDNVEKELDKAMDTSLEEFKEDAKIFGHKIEEEKKKPGSEPSEEGDKEDVSHIPD